MEMATWFGLLIGIGGILIGNAVEGGHISSLIQGAAFLIVSLGTLGATLVSHRSIDLKRAVNMFFLAFSSKSDNEMKSVSEEIIECAKIAKKDSLLALEPKLKDIVNPFLKEIVHAIVDGVKPEMIEEIFQEKISQNEESLLASAKVWTDAGGYSPTIGIIGAVLGLIHVMQNISNTSKLGTGIAVAFVATVYGVGLANLILLPIGNKLKRIVANKIKVQEMILSAGLGIAAGLSPQMVQIKLNGFYEFEEK